MSLPVAAASLLLPVLLGILCGRVRLFEPVDQAVDHLNRFALYVAFPALILAGQLGETAPLPLSLAFWGLVPAALAIALLPVRWVGRRLDDTAGTQALVLSFPNVAYLGLPVVAAVLGPEALGPASLLVGVHVVLSMTVGPVLLLAWSGQGGAGTLGASLRKVARQPLFWAAVLGAAARALPEGAVREVPLALLAPLGSAAGPASMFLLGLYLYAHADRVRGLDGAAWAHVGLKLVWLPAVTAVLVGLAHRAGALGVLEGQVLLLQAAMPPAITTFALAREYGTGDDRVAQAIAAGTVLSAVTLPVVAVAVLAAGA